MLAVAAAPRFFLRFAHPPLIAQDKSRTDLYRLGDGPWNDPRCEAGAPIEWPQPSLTAMHGSMGERSRARVIQGRRAQLQAKTGPVLRTGFFVLTALCRAPPRTVAR